MHELASESLARAGFPSHGHVAHQVMSSQLRRIDLVVALDRRHQQTLRSLGADPDRLVLLRHFDATAGAAADVPDPYYGDHAVFDECPRHDRRSLLGPRRLPGDPLGQALGRLAVPSVLTEPCSASHAKRLVSVPPAGVRSPDLCHSAAVVSRRVMRRRRQFAAGGALSSSS